MLHIRLGIFLIITANMQLFSMSDLEEKKYNVGFKYYQEYDATRLYIYKQDTIFRPMLIHFWYPSKEESNEYMNFKQYIDLISIREDYSKTKDAIDGDTYNFVDAYAQFAKNSYKIGLDISTQQILESQVKAILDLPMDEGAFPLIIYAPSNSKSPIQNHLICEQLASQGYYVISVASAGDNSIQRKEPGPSILAQVKDMEFILKYAEKNMKLEYETLGIFSFSTGGLASSIFQMKNSNVKSLCSLDGSQEYSFYIYLTKLEEFNVDKTKVPYMLMHNKEISSVYPYYNSVKSKNKFAVRMPYIDHFGFVSFWSFFDQCSADTIQHNYTLSYQYLCKYAVGFFDATLKGNKNSFDKLRDSMSKNKDFAQLETLDNSQATCLLNYYLCHTIDSAISIYSSNKTKGVDNYNYNEEEISYLGRTLLDYDIDASVKLFVFNAEQYPTSWHCYFDLGYSYQLKNEMDLAKTAFLKALELNPDNKDIKNKLSELPNSPLKPGLK